MKQTVIANSISLLAIAATAWLLLRKREQTTLEEAAEMPQATTATSYPNPGGKTRGLRNNNPLNIEYSKNTVWQGEIRPSSDTRFAQFQTMAYGYRAAFKTLFTYINKYGVNTLQGIIKRWDPGSSTYVTNVSNWTGFSPNKVFTVNDEAALVKLVSAMSRMENGVTPSTTDVYNGWKLATA